MKIKITAGGIYGKGGEIKIGTEFDVKSVPAHWESRCVVVDSSERQMVVNPKDVDPVKGDKPDELTKLRADYKELTGKKPDGRWSAERLDQAIAEALAE
jgi:hypothetical protein